MVIMEGQGVVRYVGDEYSPSVLCFFVTMVWNGGDTMRFPCSALNGKVVRNSKQARTNDKRNHTLMMVAMSAPNVKLVQNKRG